MAITYTWIIDNVTATAEAYEGNDNVVRSIDWYVQGRDDENNVRNHYGTTELSLPTVGAAFTPYENITEAQMIGWVKDNLGTDGVAAAEADVATQLSETEVPDVYLPPLPWHL
jgi:hypothetical protein